MLLLSQLLVIVKVKVRRVYKVAITGLNLSGAAKGALERAYSHCSMAVSRARRDSLLPKTFLIVS